MTPNRRRLQLDLTLTASPRIVKVSNTTYEI